MRISDWSSDVCSSDLPGRARPGAVRGQRGQRIPRRTLSASAADAGGPAVPRPPAPGDAAPGARLGAAGTGDPVRHQTAVRGRPQAAQGTAHRVGTAVRSEEHTSELQSLMRISYAVFCLKKKIYKS